MSCCKTSKTHLTNAIILNQKLYPSHIGPAFLETYKDIVERRLAAKKAGMKAMAVEEEERNRLAQLIANKGELENLIAEQTRKLERLHMERGGW